MKMKKKTVKIPLYGGGITMYQVKELNDVRKMHPRLPEDLSDSDAIAFQESNNDYYMAFESEITASTIAHEALHITNYIYKDVGIIYDPNNNEPYCYMLGFIVKQCHKFLKVNPEL